MSKNKQLLVLLLLLSAMPALGQRISIGQKVPDVMLKNVINYPKDQMRLSDFKGKLIILSFWGTICSSCIEEIPELISLQKEFKNKIQIIAVNQEGRDLTVKFLQQRKSFFIPNFPFVTQDTILSRIFFPHAGDPFLVWIDSADVVRYLLPYSPYAATAKYIRQFLSGQHPKLPSYQTDTYIHSLMNDRWKNKVTYYSYISHWIPGIQIGNGEAKQGSVEISADRASAVELYIQAFDEFNKHDFNRPGTLCLDFKDSFKYVRPKKYDPTHSWATRYAYNYQLLLPASKKKDRFRIMQQDLLRYFGLDARVVKKNVKCWVLVRTSKVDKLHTLGGATKFNLRMSNMISPVATPVRGLVNEPYWLLSNDLQAWVEYRWKAPFVDSTDYNKNERVDFHLKGSVADSFKTRQVNQALARYDLRLIKEDHPIDVLVISDRDSD
jgi:thiol-disulfide isomerase/thioredoxin